MCNKSAFLRQADRRLMLRGNNATQRTVKMGVRPSKYPACCFKRIPLAMKRRGNHPAHLSQSDQGRGNLPLIIRQTDLADESTVFKEDSPITETHHLPVARVAQQTAPTGFAR